MTLVIKKKYYKARIKFHTKMREFYESNETFNNPMKCIFHDLRIQRYENKIV